MLTFVGLRPKLYSFVCEREVHFDLDKNGIENEVDKQTSTSVAKIVLDNKVTANGVKTSVAKKLSFDNYEYCLSSLSPKRVDIKELVRIFIGCLRIVERRLDYLPLIRKGGYVMLVFQRMHLDTGKRNCKFYTHDCA